MSILKLLGRHTFDLATTKLLAAAFDTAWLKMQQSNSNIADDRLADTRELLAQRIIEIAERGERTPQLLVDGALAQFQPST